MKLKRLDTINVAAIVLSILGLLLEIIGAAVSVPTSVGLNFNLSPLVYVGIAVAVIGLIVAIIGSAKTEKAELNKAVSTAALYIAVIAVLILPIIAGLAIAMPVINPTNG